MSVNDGAVPQGATAADDSLQDLYSAGFWTKVLLNGTLIAIITFLLMKIFMKRNEPQEEEQEDTVLPKMKKRDFTIQELREFDGTKGDGRILVAINGKVFDVTKGKHFYGPGTLDVSSSFIRRPSDQYMVFFVFCFWQIFVCHLNCCPLFKITLIVSCYLLCYSIRNQRRCIFNVRWTWRFSWTGNVFGQWQRWIWRPQRFEFVRAGIYVGMGDTVYG